MLFSGHVPASCAKNNGQANGPRWGYLLTNVTKLKSESKRTAPFFPLSIPESAEPAPPTTMPAASSFATLVGKVWGIDGMKCLQ